MAVRVLLWGYRASPFVHKAELMLALKEIPHSRIEVPMNPPRPELVDLFGISYRKVPLLAIGNDIYCDTSLIAETLERRFPPSEGYASFFPRRVDGGSLDRALLKAFTFWGDRVLFEHGGRLLPWEKAHNVREDRLQFFGDTMQGMIEKRGKFMSSLQSNLTLLEDQLQDDRHWLVNTETPSLADITIYAFVNWLNSMRAVRENVLTGHFYPKIITWFKRFGQWIEAKSKSGKGVYDKLSGGQAAALMTQLIFDCDEIIDPVDAIRLGLKPGNLVSVCPNDTGRIPTVGKLVTLNFREVVLETVGRAKRPVRVHFPRIGYDLEDAGPPAAKL